MAVGLSIYQWYAVDKKTMPKVLIAGMGATGESVANYLHAQGVNFNMFDQRNDLSAAEQLREKYPEQKLFLGDLGQLDLKRYETIILSPGISRKTPEIAAAIASGVEVIGDIELFARVAHAPVIAVTGSNGKSTVVHLVSEMAEMADVKVALGGNFGTPALDLVTAPEPDLYILELSSFQLESTVSLQPRAAVVLNVSEDHMDRYADYDEYVQTKAAIYSQAGVQIINRDDPVARQLAANRPVISFGLDEPLHERDYGLRKIDDGEWLMRGETPLLPVTSLRLVGRHNIANALAALALGEVAGLAMPSMLMTLRQYRGLPHRTQWVSESKAVTWINDSKATNVGATLAALEGLDSPVVLIAGGQSKDADLTPLHEAVKKSVRAAVLIGEDAELLGAVMQGATDVHYADSMRDAVQQASKLSKRGDIVLLSPACASFDMFKGYANRGEIFMRQVFALQRKR
jgi:UDP-N-acetylmuramoylalanine--D-glutamate ligase